jgi:hypothetical protein
VPIPNIPDDNRTTTPIRSMNIEIMTKATMMLGPYPFLEIIKKEIKNDA